MDKKLGFLFVILFSVNVFAGGEFGGTGDARELFRDLDPVEAYYYHGFTKKIYNINLPGTSTSYKPNSSLCIDGDVVRTTRPKLKCELFRVPLRTREFGEKFADFRRERDAERKAKSDNGRGKYECIKGEHYYPSIPISYDEFTCTLWEVERHDSHRPEQFKSKRRAEDYADENSHARGRPKCVREGWVSRSMRTTFQVEFYADPKERSHLGAHKYLIPKCTKEGEKPVIEASGEFSGTGFQTL